MSGIFPITFTGGVPPSDGVPYAYKPTQTEQPHVLYYGSSCVTITQAQFNALLSEFAAIFDLAGWIYNPSQEANLWGALSKAFANASSGGDETGGGVQTINGKTSAEVELTVDDIPGAAPLDSPDFYGSPTAPTRATSDASRALANTEFVQNAILAAFAGLEDIANASKTVYGLSRFATSQEITDGAENVAVDAAALQAAIASGGGGGAGSPPITITFPVTSVAMTVFCPRRIGAWSALYVNGLRQDATTYAVNGQSITLLASTANVGDVCTFDFVPL